jgi:vacuolar-type H+-ATPase subunit H
MSPVRRSPSPEVAAFRVEAEDSRKQLLSQARERARLIRSGAADELTEADVEGMVRGFAAAARARLDAAVPADTAADQELQDVRREAAMLMAAAARDADAELRKAWRARQKTADRS